MVNWGTEEGLRPATSMLVLRDYKSRVSILTKVVRPLSLKIAALANQLCGKEKRESPVLGSSGDAQPPQLRLGRDIVGPLVGGPLHASNLHANRSGDHPGLM